MWKHEDTWCDDCTARPPPWDWARAAAMYGGGMRDLVLGLKHADRQDTVPLLAHWMGQAIAGKVSKDTVFVPIPLHRWRYFRRRFNQSALIAGAVAKGIGASVLQGGLIRHRRTPSLDGRTRDDRWSLLADAISVCPKYADQIRDRPVVLVDDVMTTGATLSACYTALQTVGPSSVGVAVLARVGLPP